MTVDVIERVDAEETDLKLHVDLCAQRYEQMDKRMTSVEEKIDALTERVDNIGDEFKKSLVGAVVTIIVALIGAVGTIVGVVITHVK